jgi:hypothetical protein
MPASTLSLQSIHSMGVIVSSGSGSTPLIHPFDISALTKGNNTIQITNPDIITRYSEPGKQHSHSIYINYGVESNKVAHNVESLFVGTPITLSNFGPFNLDFVSGGTFTLPQPTSSSNITGTFSYSIVGSSGVLSILNNVVTMLTCGMVTIRATLNVPSGYASPYIDSTLTVNAIPPTFSNGGIFNITSKVVGDSPFMPLYPSSNSSGQLTYTSSNPSVATVDPITGLVTILTAGSTNIVMNQAAAGIYSSAQIFPATLVVTLPNTDATDLSMSTFNGNASFTAKNIPGWRYKTWFTLFTNSGVQHQLKYFDADGQPHINNVYKMYGPYYSWIDPTSYFNVQSYRISDNTLGNLQRLQFKAYNFG